MMTDLKKENKQMNENLREEIIGNNKVVFEWLVPQSNIIIGDYIEGSRPEEILKSNYFW